MRTNILSFITSSENRKKIVKTLLEYPNRQWSCTYLEEASKLSHATVFRTLKGLQDFGILKSTKINKKDILYELVKESPLTKEVERMLNIDSIAANSIATSFINQIKNEIHSASLFGSTISKNIKPDSDIDILIILKTEDKKTKIQDKAALLSSKYNKTISPTIMTLEELKKEKDTQFIKSIMENSEVVYGKNPFQTS
tara:strand:+ start:6111 stop:6704 length:594 start_codon:yes stop_codon:yes gene_type:complete